jgi:hypothetical protein
MSRTAVKTLPSRLSILFVLLALAPRAGALTNWDARIRPAADFLLELQTEHGCIPDAPGSVRANKDSTMEYALMGLAHAYLETGRDRFRRGMRDGIEWLASRMETRQRGWVGSWRFAYAAKPPYVALPTSPGKGIEDARGVSATSALFAYLVALYTEVAQDDLLAQKYESHVRAAMDFVLERNRGENNLFYSAWHRRAGTRRWTLYPMQYAADQADVYLGLRGAYYLYGSHRYKLAGEKMERAIPQQLYHSEQRVFAIARTPEGKLIPPDEGWKGYFVQGYLAWVFGPHDETRHALDWLEDRQAPDHSFRRTKEQTPYTLAAAVFCLGARRLGRHGTDRDQAKRWLRDNALTPQGGIRDFAHPRAPVYTNLSGWVIAAWANASPFPIVKEQPPDAPVWRWRGDEW